MGEEEVGLQVDVEHEVPIGLRVVDGRGRRVDARVVHEDVDASPLACHLTDDLVDLARARRIAGHHQALAPGVADCSGGLVELGDGSTGHGHVGAVLGQADGDGATEATTPAGDEGLLAGEIEEGWHQLDSTQRGNRTTDP